MSGKVRFSIDRGGTFTDIYAEIDDKKGSKRCRVLKLLSVDPDNYPDAPREGIRRILEEFFETEHPRHEPLETSNIESIRMGTTVATNALLEREGARFALVTTKGFADIWHIGNQSRPDIFDLTIRCPDTLYESVVQVDERIVLGTQDAMNAIQNLNKQEQVFRSVTGENVIVEKQIDQTEIRKQLQTIKDQGINCIAVVLMHAALYPEHEIVIGKIANELGFQQISLSHKVMQMVKIVPRGFTTSADAYLTPHIKEYLKTFVSGFDENLLKNVNVSFMQSDGGLTRVDRFSGHRAILSGPAGGVVGYAMTTKLAKNTAFCEASSQIVGFDMGGTSTDVSRYAGIYEHVFETTTAGVTIQAPQLDINTVAAGGGSMLKFVSGIFQVGPQSVGAHPGPVCYRKGGQLAVTDANVVLGRLIPEYFPHIFGPNEDQPLDAEASKKAFLEMSKDIPGMNTPEQIAFGFVKVANEAMCRPIRNLTQMRGYDLSKHTLACFGGAGGQHACAIARSLGMKKVFIHRYSGILSAFGIGLADVVEDLQEPCSTTIPFASLSSSLSSTCTLSQEFQQIFNRLQQSVCKSLEIQGFQASDMTFEYYLNMRYQGTDTALMARSDNSKCSVQEFVKVFLETYKREYGFQLNERDIIVDDVRVRGSGQSWAKMSQQEENSSSALHTSTKKYTDSPIKTSPVYFNGSWTETPLYKLQDLAKDVELQGPAIILDPNSTVVIEPHCVAYISSQGDITVDILEAHEHENEEETERQVQKKSIQVEVADPIQLSLFSHRFMGIAEQMGRTLQRTSVSVNIKERLDFSCALFGPDGGLVANAPHIPVHLGAMQEAIRFQYNYYQSKKGENDNEEADNSSSLQDGDVLVSNHPQLAGGSHLPDITVITPCFQEGEIVFWVASRGHHADVGGITPGSMPPHSKYLHDEGAAIVSFKLVKGGQFQEQGITNILSAPSNPNDPDCKGTRTLKDNLSDLKAQVAANNHGVRLVHDLVKEYDLQFVQKYMHFIQQNAESAVRDMLRNFVATKGVSTVTTCDHLDDGTKIQIKIDIDPKTGNADFDFDGTGPQVFGNLNAPPSVTYSAIIYSLRCLVGLDIPLNQGCLAPITINIPKYCILNPSQDSAVVGGNVLTSQRVVDVILKAFSACAASQGCMNNLTFGDETFGYYETIAGGAGAGPTWNGRSGVHTHMTNTRITDPEILERRYPVVLRQFSLRPGSGGAGLHPGGDGVIREIEFLRPVTVSILSERRSFQPYGLEGGKSAQVGQNLLLRRGRPGLVQSLGGKNSVHTNVGDRIRILTPGGGGFGKLSSLS